MEAEERMNTAVEARPALTVDTVSRFLRLSHTFFSLPLVLCGLWLGAGGWPSWRVLLLGVVAAIGARTAAMAQNRIADRAIDARNPRTRERELPRGAMTLGQARAVLAAGVALYLLAAGLLGRLTLWLAPVPLVVFAGYPYLKRFTPLCHFGVGLALGLAPLGAWIAVRQNFSGWLEILPLGLFGLFWVSGFDVIYATLDEDFDRSSGVHSLPAALGRRNALRVSALLHVLAFATLAWLWRAHAWTSLTLLPLAAAGILLYLEQRWSRHVDLAFFRINIVIGFVVAAMVAIGVFVR